MESLIAQLQKQHDAELLEAAPHDIAAFGEFMDPEWVPAPHHQLILNKLDQHFIHGENGRLIVVAPVGHGKSVYSSLLTPAFQFGINPHERIIAAGHTQEFVENAIAKKVRGIIQSDRYKKVFPNTIISSESRAADYFTLVQQRPGTPGHYLAKGVGGGISGFRATRIVADDLFPNMQKACSKAFRDLASTWWHSDLSTRLLPGGNTVLVITRWVATDVVGELLEAMEKGGERWETVILPALCEDPENDPMGRKEGEALWPDYHTAESLLIKKANIPATSWHALYQCAPTSAGGGLIQEEWFKYWEELPKPEMVKRRFVSFDVANTANARSDWSVGTCWLETYDKRYYLVDIVRARVEFPDLVRMITEFSSRHSAQAILVEDAGAGQSLLQAYKGKMPAPMIPMSPRNASKVFRVDEITPLFEAGAVLLPKRHELLPEVTRELIEGVGGKHDDILDSIAHALRWSRGSNIKRGTRKLHGAF